MVAAVADLDAGGVLACLLGGDTAAVGDRLLGVDVDGVDHIPFLNIDRRSIHRLFAIEDSLAPMQSNQLTELLILGFF